MSTLASAFLQRPCVVEALAAPHTCRSVLNFFFGTRYLITRADGEVACNPQLDSWKAMSPMQSIWFGAPSLEYDTAARKFSELIHASSTGQLAFPGHGDETEWLTIHGLLARILLADQYPRRVSRGTANAFAFDCVARSEVRTLLSEEGMRSTISNLPAAGLLFVGMPLVHSERIHDHDTYADFNQRCHRLHPTFPFMEQLSFALEHRNVVARFGRYPHRNAILGRNSSAEEVRWLVSDERPSWAWV